MSLGGYRSGTVGSLRRGLTARKGGRNSKGSLSPAGSVANQILAQIGEPKLPSLAEQQVKLPLWQQGGYKNPNVKPTPPVKPPTPPVRPPVHTPVSPENRYLVPGIATPKPGVAGDTQYWADFVQRKAAYDQVVNPLVAQINALYNRRTGGFDSYQKLAGLERADWSSETSRRNASLAQRGLLRSGTRVVSDGNAASDLYNRIDRLSGEYGEQKVNNLYQQALQAKQGFAGELSALLAGALGRAQERGGTPITAKPKKPKKPKK